MKIYRCHICECDHC